MPKLCDLDLLNNTPILQQYTKNIEMTPIKLEEMNFNERQTAMPKNRTDSLKKSQNIFEYLNSEGISPLVKSMKIKVLNFGKEEDDESKELPFQFY